MSFVEEAGDSNAHQDMDGQGDEGVELKEGSDKGHGCCSPKHMGGKE